MTDRVTYFALGALLAVVVWATVSALMHSEESKADTCRVCKGADCVGCLEFWVTTGENPFLPVDCDWWGSPEFGALPCGEAPGTGGGDNDDDEIPWPDPNPKEPCDESAGSRFQQCFELCRRLQDANWLNPDNMPDQVRRLYESICRSRCALDHNCQRPLSPGPCLEPLCPREG